MTDLKTISKIYFIGIGGIGMSALARYFAFHGKSVSGYDKTKTSLTEKLSEEGIPVHYEDNIALMPKDAEMVVYTPAIPKDHSELQYYRDNGYTLLKRSEVLGAITAGSFNICVAGTHGKTTITTMTAHILRHSGYGCNAFLGGIAVNYNTNFWSSERNVCVVEADEYDRSFLKLNPDIAVITAVDADHLDIYGTEKAVQDAFIAFALRVKTGGMLLTKGGLAREAEFGEAIHFTYSLKENNVDAYTKNVQGALGSYRFDVVVKDWTLGNVELNMGGLHNIENITAAITIAHYMGIEDEKIKQAVAAFKGVKRRFEYVINNGKEIFIDDYAHHPEELKALITGAKDLFPGLNCTVIFQPHLFSRTRDFAEGFAESLDLADQVVLLPIYPARELPMPGVTSHLIAGKMKNGNVKVLTKEELLHWINDHDTRLLITAGAGDIDTLVAPLKRALEMKNQNG